MYEFSTVMCIAAVIACNIYIGMLNTHSWTWWSVGSALVGPVVILAFTGVYAAFRPGLFYTEVYGLNDFLWPSVQFWLGNFLTIVLSLLPRYLYRYYSEMYFPTDIEILRHIDHQDPNHDWKTERKGFSEPDRARPPLLGERAKAVRKRERECVSSARLILLRSQILTIQFDSSHAHRAAPLSIACVRRRMI